MDRKRILDTGDRIITPDVKIEDCNTEKSKGKYANLY